MQSKIQKRGGEVHPPSIFPHIALFLEADGGCSEEIVDLTEAEYVALKHAVPRKGILMLMANAALEKINFPGTARHQPTGGSGSAAGIDKERAKDAKTKALSDELLDAIEHDTALRLRAGIVTCVWIGPDRQECARVDFPSEVFAHIKAICIKRRITLQQFSDEAIHHYVELRKDRRAA